MQISENSRIWIYQADREFTADEAKHIQQQLDQFTSQWLAHGNQLAAKGEIRHRRFIILSVDEQQAGATGCSIDKSVRLMKEIEQQFKVSLFDRLQIAYRDGETIKVCNRESFEDLLRTGHVNLNTIVFNNMVAARENLAEDWEIPMKNSWHAKVFETLINSSGKHTQQVE